MSRVQLNLLPDIKLAYNRAQQTKKVVFTTAFLVSAVSVAIFLLMLFTVEVVQKKQMSDAGKEVDKASNDLKNIPQINQIITVQNQLHALSALHQNKHIPSRIYTYLSKLTPADVTINKLDLDLTLNTIKLAGKAPSQANVNAFIDTIKVATYKINSEDKPQVAFPTVLESGFTISGSSIGYTISLTFDPKLFVNTTDNNGKPVTPALTVKATGGSTLNPSSTLFNSSASSGSNQ